MEERVEGIKGRMDNIEVRMDRITEEVIEDINTKVKSATEGIKEEVTQNVENLIVVGFTEIDTRLKRQDETITQNIKEQDRKIDDNIKRLDQLPHTSNSANTYTHTNIITKTDELYYYGDSRMHPKIFITRLQQQLQNTKHNMTIKQFIQEKLRGDAELWFQMVEERIDTFDQFETLFIKQYWGESNQRKIRANLFNGKYTESEGISREKYIIRKIYNIRYLEPKFTEDEMVRYLARHFNDDIHNVIITQRITTFDNLIEYIRNIDEYKTGWKNSTFKYNNRYENKYNERYNSKNTDRQNFNANNQENRNFETSRNNTYENNNRRSYNNSNNRERQDYYRNNQGNGNYENKQVRWEDRQTQGNYGDQRKTYAQINNTNIERQNDSKNLARASEMNKIEVVPQMHN